MKQKGQMRFMLGFYESVRRKLPFHWQSFFRSMTDGKIPLYWKRANVVPIHKKGDRGDADNYSPVSLTLVGRMDFLNFAGSVRLSFFLM